ncbi:MAG: hypothetical protein MUF87_15390, partial [Anaerolineae bacterium]|nr:hypothetical protein [Anaerolineae bacterium]
ATNPRQSSGDANGTGGVAYACSGRVDSTGENKKKRIYDYTSQENKLYINKKKLNEKMGSG